MKKIKKGFTLAEVLITLSIIGVVAAITLPTMMTSYQYSTIGVKLSKFLSSTENAARAYVTSSGVNFGDGVLVTNADGTTTEEGANIGVTRFVNDSFIIKGTRNATIDEDVLEAVIPGAASEDYPSFYSVTEEELGDLSADQYRSQDEMENGIAVLKDGTTISITMLPEGTDFETHTGIETNRVGLPIFNINFDPRIQGLPGNIHKNYNFVVTELGFVFPHDDDECLWSLYNVDFKTSASYFGTGTVCNEAAAGS